MAKFEFRLQQVLDYRAMEEGWAKSAYLEARANRIEKEVELAALHDHRKTMLGAPVFTLDEHRNLEVMLLRLDDEEEELKAVINVLQNEEEVALNTWHDRKRDLEVLVKLREKAEDEWKAEEARREQAELDEWTSMRRAA